MSREVINLLANNDLSTQTNVQGSHMPILKLPRCPHSQSHTAHLSHRAPSTFALNPKQRTKLATILSKEGASTQATITRNRTHASKSQRIIIISGPAHHHHHQDDEPASSGSPRRYNAPPTSRRLDITARGLRSHPEAWDRIVRQASSTATTVHLSGRALDECLLLLDHRAPRRRLVRLLQALSSNAIANSLSFAGTAGFSPRTCWRSTCRRTCTRSCCGNLTT